MITKWMVSNFKSIQNETGFELSPLTIFAGPNSSGKSTFLQSILLVGQTLAHKVSSRSVVLNGPLTSLGQFDDLKSSNGLSDQITIQCTCQPLQEHVANTRRRPQVSPRGTIYYGPQRSQLKEVSCEFSFDADSSSQQRDLYQIQPRLFATKLSCVSRDEDNVDQTSTIDIHASAQSDVGIERAERSYNSDDPLRSSFNYKVTMDDDSLAEVKEDFRSAKPNGCTLQHFLPLRVTYAIDTLEEDACAITTVLQDDTRRSLMLRHKIGREFVISHEIVKVLRSILRDTINFDQVFERQNNQQSLLTSNDESITFGHWYDCLRRTSREERKNIQQALRDCDDLFEQLHNAIRSSSKTTDNAIDFIQVWLPNHLMEASWYLGNYFTSSLKYLGPLRDAPKPLYPLLPAADPNDVGIRGEHTAYIFELHKNKMIRYIPSENFNSAGIDHNTVTRTLESAVKDWLQYLGVARSVTCRDLGKLGHELKVGLSEDECTHDLTHVGVGVSQVLPILVMCFLAETDSTLVFEQPELHLHPKVQTLLGDFFLSMALCNKQCIVETHSEYLIDRLRFRIAAAAYDKELNSQTKIYFVEKPSQSSVFREVVINEYGAISDWPEGFFDQSQHQAEEILRAATMKRKANRKNRDA